MRRVPATPGRLAGAAVLVFGLGCGDGPEPLAPGNDAPLEGNIRVLTRNPGNDVMPAWLTADTVAYVAPGYMGVPDHPGIPLAVSITGGPARVLAEAELERSIGRERRFAGLARAQKGGPLVLLELAGWADGPACDAVSHPGTPYCTRAFEPHITALEVLVVDGPAGAREAAVSSGLDARGERQDSDGRVLLHVTRPFQLRHNRDGLATGAPAWAPDGSSVLFSTGTELILWRPEAGSVDVVPGTEGAVDPAWSPDGAWIAFTRLVPTGEPVHVTCACAFPSAPTMERTVYDAYRAEVVRMRADGSESSTVLVDAEDPAWGPDGALYVRYRDGIHRLLPDADATPTPVAGAEFGARPAVSPDGRWLAFQRRKSGGFDFDIWVVRLAP